MPSSHHWNVSPSEAVVIQKKLRQEVKIEKLNKNIKTIAGADVSLNLYEETIYAGIVVLGLPDLVEIDRAAVKSTTKFPYIPGLLSFREIPALLEAYKKLKVKPDIVMVDGQGIAHPRRLGIASHFGVMLDIPTIGAAKSLLTGIFEEPGLERGNFSYIYDRYNKQEIIGAAVRTKNKTKPMIISAGHKITLEESTNITLETTSKYRLPEPTRRAHLLVNNFRREQMSDGNLFSDR